MDGTALQPGIQPDPRRIGEICRHYHVRRLALFGSVLRRDFRPDSDIDVLVEFEPGRIPGLAFFSLQHDLAEAFNRPVDLNMPEDLPPEFRAMVLDYPDGSSTTHRPIGCHHRRGRDLTREG